MPEIAHPSRAISCPHMQLFQSVIFIIIFIYFIVDIQGENYQKWISQLPKKIERPALTDHNWKVWSIKGECKKLFGFDILSSVSHIYNVGK